MKLEIEVLPADNAASNWRLTTLGKLAELLDSLPIGDYSIALVSTDENLVDLTESKVPQK